MKEIQIFNHELFGAIRTMTDEQGEVFFVGKDVAKALGYAKSRNALAAHVEDDDKKDALIQGSLARKGYARNRTHSHYDSEGEMHTRTYLVWTERGRKFVHRICKDEESLLPFWEIME